MDQETTAPTTESNLPRGIWDYIKSRKKLILVVIAVVFLFIVLALTIFQIFKSRLFPVKNQTEESGQNINQNSNQSSMQIQTNKAAYSLSEKVLIKVVANSAGEVVRAFDVLIEYDPEFLSLTNKKSPALSDFTYYGSNSAKLLQVSAVQKPESKTQQVFADTSLFELEFTPKKAGKTSFKIVFVPNSTTESNLINEKSNDILTTASGTEIEITN